MPDMMSPIEIPSGGGAEARRHRQTIQTMLLAALIGAAGAISAAGFTVSGEEEALDPPTVTTITTCPAPLTVPAQEQAQALADDAQRLPGRGPQRLTRAAAAGPRSEGPST